ncbi:MAG: efflux RND transporter periplasmic adaptor subunit, partial [Leptospiraceae bacterium]|nr:efflux RND transporter periplasmic adaptor subunit [Leptospiraceae bacterium]
MHLNQRLLHFAREHRLISAFVILTALLILFLSITAIIRGIHNSALVTEAARRGSIIEAVYGIGTVRPEQSYTVKLGISATIEKLYVREGDK